MEVCIACVWVCVWVVRGMRVCGLCVCHIGRSFEHWLRLCVFVCAVQNGLLLIFFTSAVQNGNLALVQWLVDWVERHPLPVEVLKERKK